MTHFNPSKLYTKGCRQMWYSTKARLTRFDLHCGPFHITLSFGICYSEVKCVGPFYQIGQEEDRMMV